jgi:diguanylate cyclase (GGDEF)-like protein/PAS domain S-box-containing protein
MARRSAAPAPRGGAAAGSHLRPDSPLRPVEPADSLPLPPKTLSVVPDLPAVAAIPGGRNRRRPDSPGARLRRAIAEGRPLPPSAFLRIDPVLVALADSERHLRTLIDQAADGIIVIDAKRRVILANSRACEMHGYTAEEMIGLDLLDTYLPEEREIALRRVDSVANGPLRFERLLRRKDGSAIPVDVSVAWLPNGESQSILRDITDRKRAEESLRLEEKRLRALIRISEHEMGTLEKLLEVTLEEVVALSDSTIGYTFFYDEEARRFTLSSWSKGAIEASRLTDERMQFDLSETGVWAEAVRQRRPIVMNDFDAPDPRKRGYPDGHPSLRRFMAIPVISRGRVVATVGVANKAAEYTDTDVSQLTQMMDVVWRMAERQKAEEALRALAEDLECRVEERTHAAETANRELADTNTELDAANEELQKLLREQERLQSELAYRALHDPLTGLANRTMFQERLEHAFRVSERGVAVVWIDLDHFKEVNDIFGHDVGDEMLLAVADRLRDTVRETDDIARMGGDEFAIVLPNVIETEAEMVGDRILAAMNDRTAFRLQIGASVGIGWQRGNLDGQQLLRSADQAMYRAKAAGGGRAILG